MITNDSKSKSQVLLQEARSILSELIESSFLDSSLLASDCLEVFDTYDWEPNESLSQEELARWQELLQKGCDSELDYSNLTEFLNLSSPYGQNHIYFYRIQARKLIDRIEVN
ncbi:hypothetical protein QXB71_003594 [Vibrio cholerae]|nr:hypothetical protein [Vibrio cholerae]